MARSPDAAWDLPIRAFHWALVALAVFSFVTGKLGGSWMPWHMRSGYTILTLVLFRLAWGAIGPSRSRFAAFVRSPRALVDHARALASRTFAPGVGHTPIGGWMVLALLGALALQAGTGLFSNDESAHEGPLAAKVSNAMVDRLSTVHAYNQWLLVALVAIHVAAVAFYEWRLNARIVRPMVFGGPGDAATLVRALACLAVAAALVYFLVVVYPSR